MKKVCILILFYSPFFCFSQTANSNGNWSDASNWVGGNIGDAPNEDVRINDERTLTIQQNETYTIQSLELGEEAHLIINQNGTLIITGDLEKDEAARITVNGSLTVQGNYEAGEEAILITSGSGSAIFNGTFEADESVRIRAQGSSSIRVDGAATFDEDVRVFAEGNGSSITFNGNIQADEAFRLISRDTNTSIVVNGDIISDEEAVFRSEDSGSLIINGNLTGDEDAVLFNESEFIINGNLAVDEGSKARGNQNIPVSGTCSDGGSGVCADSQIAGTLPVELTSLEAYTSEGEVVVVWITQSEINNDYFEIQRSKDGDVYNLIGEVDGQGTKNTPTEYSYTDKSPLEGISFYRLKQTDFDGKFEISDAVSVNFQSSKEFEIEVYPNPFNGHNLYLKIPNSESIEFEIFVNDLLGRNYITDLTFINQGDFTLTILELSDNLPNGIYYVNILINGEVTSKKVVVQ